VARIDRFIEALFERGADNLVLASNERAELGFADGARPITSSRLQTKLLSNFLAEIVPEALSGEIAQEGEHGFAYAGPHGTAQVAVTRSGETLRIEVMPGPTPPQPPAQTPPAKPTPRKSESPAAPVTRPVAVRSAPDSDAPAADTGEMDALFREMVSEGCSDLHLSSACAPLFRKDGGMVMLSRQEPLAAERVHEMLYSITPPRRREEFEERSDTDFSYEISGLARFRCNLFQDRKGVGGVFRVIPSDILTVEDLGLSREILKLCHLMKGLVVVTGPTGSGKSTTLAAMIDYINRKRSAHIITIEDPIEFVHDNQKCLINQREIGNHTDGFKPALRAALREDPDIVMVGEMRDLETVEIAIETAETGHLVFGTLHTNTAASTVDRIIDQFSTDRQEQIRTMLSGSLKGVIAQTLCRKKGGGRVAALEVLIANAAIGNLIREGKTFQIPSIMQTGKKLGMKMLNDALLELVGRDLVTPEEAYAKAVDRASFATLAAGQNIQLDTSAELD
jgi:twitching motility protein PilT